MTRVGANIPSLALFNEHVVLEAIRRAGSISRVELARKTGLTAQTVSTIARRLLADGLIEEGRRERSTGGKPRTPLRVRPAAAAAVGLHLDPWMITTVVIDLGGRQLYAAHVPPPRHRGDSELLRLIVREANAAITSAGIRRGGLMGVGLAAPGPVDRMPLATPEIDYRLLLPAVVNELQCSPTQVVVESDATAAAIAQYWLGGESLAEDFGYLYLGAGVGVGLVLGGSVYRGVAGNVGDIGHSSVDQSGPECYCGNRGCLDLYCSPRAVIAAAGVPVPGRADVAEVYADVCVRAAAGDPAAGRAVHGAARRLAVATLNLVNVLDIDQVFVGGSALVDDIADLYLSAIRNVIAAQTGAGRLREVTIEQPSLDDAAAVGVAASVLHQAMGMRQVPLLDGVSGP